MTDVIIGTDLVTNEPVRFPDPTKEQGTYIVGKNGTGKTNLIANLIVDDIEHGRSLILLDPHGDLSSLILTHIPKHRIEDTVLLDLTDEERPPSLNLFECSNRNSTKEVTRTVDTIVQAFKKVWAVGEHAAWGPRLQHLLTIVARTLVMNPGSTMADIPRLLNDLDYRRQMMKALTNPAHLAAWERYNGLKGRLLEERIESTLNKVDLLLIDDVVYHIVSQPISSIRMREFMDEGKIVLIKMPVGELGEEAVSLLGSVLVGQIYTAAMGRSSTNFRPNVNVYADEYQLFATVAFSQLIDQARKYNVRTLVAHQRREQLDQAERNAPLGAANLILFEVVGDDGTVFTKQFTAPREMEVFGQKPKVVKSPQPFTDLIARGHADPVWQTISYEIDHNNWIHNQKWLAREKTDRFLYAKMNGSMPEGSSAETDGVFSAIGDRSGSPTYMEYVYALVPAWRTGASWEALPHAAKAAFDRLYQAQLQQGNFTTPEEAVDKARQWHRGVVCIIELGRMVEREPIMTQTGAYEDMLRPRSINDLQTEIANKLTVQPNFYAWVNFKLKEGRIETQIETEELAKPGSDDPDNYTDYTDVIRAQSRALYGRSPVAPEVAIAEELPKPPPAPREKRVSRIGQGSGG